MWGADLEVRHRLPELMDDPSLDRARHLHALQALARVNRVSLAASRIIREVHAIAGSRPGPVRVLDVACGGGDVLIDVAKRLQGTTMSVELCGCDVSPVALGAARQAAPDAVGIDFVEVDAIEGALPAGYDLICSSLFLHHLSPEVVIRLLQRMVGAATHSVLIQDLRRTRLGYVFAWIGLHALTRSDVARTDGLISVRAAFTVPEVEALCRDAGLTDVQVSAIWPQRYSIRWRRP